VTEDRASAERGWVVCQNALAGGEYDILVFDELTYPINFGWLRVEDVISTIANRPRGTHVIVTGRRAPDALIDAADLVTEMRVIKHPLREQGIRAQAGIDV
jgi:cob(I)alamin adenosyltransferase